MANIEKNDNTETKASETKEERVPVFIPRGLPNDEPNFYISINDVDYLLPRGETSYVPPHVAKRIERHYRAENQYERKKNELIDRTKSPTNMK